MVLEKLSTCHPHAKVDDILRYSIPAGVAYHHSGTLPF